MPTQRHVIGIAEATADVLSSYAEIPIAFEVRTRNRVQSSEDGVAGVQLVEEVVEPAYVKDYDALPGEGPLSWRSRWDLSNWVILSAWEEGRRIGGAALATRTPGLDMLEGREDIAVLWDIRILPARRGRGIGSALFERAVEVARGIGCTRLRVETQDVNVPACRFYARRGCVVVGVDPTAYPDLPDETMLVWEFDFL